MTVYLERGYNHKEFLWSKNSIIFYERGIRMILVGIDVAKDKHDCFIMSSEGEVLYKSFTIANNMEGFNELYQKISSTSDDLSKIKVGLEATGHYSYNILGYLLDKGLTTFVINPLHTSLYRKSLSLRKTKTDKVDSHTIASMLMSDVNLKSYSETLYHNEELKSLTRYRFDKVKERAKLKQSISRLVTILFPELEKLVSTLHMVSIYALLSEFPSAKAIANAHLTKLTNLLYEVSKGRYTRETAIMFRESARNSIGSYMPAKSLELKHTIKLIGELDNEIEEIEAEIKRIMDEINSPIRSIPGIGLAMGAMIVAEIGDF
jgi:transposase